MHNDDAQQGKKKASQKTELVFWLTTVAFTIVHETDRRRGEQGTAIDDDAGNGTKHPVRTRKQREGGYDAFHPLQLWGVCR